MGREARMEEEEEGALLLGEKSPQGSIKCSGKSSMTSLWGKE
jgi:hypothetical protein